MRTGVKTNLATYSVTCNNPTQAVRVGAISE